MKDRVLAGFEYWIVKKEEVTKRAQPPDERLYGSRKKWTAHTARSRIYEKSYSRKTMPKRPGVLSIMRISEEGLKMQTSPGPGGRSSRSP